jgi:hypothetical protein
VKVTKVVSVRAPKGTIQQSCAGCGKYFGSNTWQQARGLNREDVAFVNYYMGEQWLRSEIFHKDCYVES